jgi:O-acetyl-ADP-ribose deacetylase (regulator of RNase III)
MNGETKYTINKATISIIQGDITQQVTDAIVNAANSSLMGGGGVDGAIHGAGGPAILEECKKIVAKQGRLPAGQAVITTAGNMKAKKVIHTVGPIWHGESLNEAETLASAYHESLKLAASHNLSSISFPSISTGAYGYPVDKAARTALRTVAAFLAEASSIKEVVFVLFDARTFDTYAIALRDIIEEEGKTEE